MAFAIEFALDGTKPAVVVHSGNQIDACVLRADPTFRRKFRIGPDFIEALHILRVILEKDLGKIFKIGAFLTFALGAGAITLEKVFEYTGHGIARNAGIQHLYRIRIFMCP